LNSEEEPDVPSADATSSAAEAASSSAVATIPSRSAGGAFHCLGRGKTAQTNAGDESYAGDVVADSGSAGFDFRPDCRRDCLPYGAAAGMRNRGRS
jgi:hypothetical protein